MAVTARGEDTPTKIESSDEEEEEEGEVTPPPLSPPHETLPHSMISLVNKWGPQFAYNTRSGPRQRLGHRLACLSSPTSH
jgi:hypothetical protein